MIPGRPALVNTLAVDALRALVWLATRALRPTVRGSAIGCGRGHR